MVFLFFSAILFFASFCGVGLLASRLTFFKVREDNFFLNFFTGFALIGVYFSFVQLFLPLTLWTLIPVLLAGLCGLALCREEIKGRIAAAPLFFAVCLFFFYLIAYVISGKSKIDAYDDFLYHASIVSWLNAYKAVPGIANLHFRLGMNSLYLQVAAGLDVGVWDKHHGLPDVFLLPDVLSARNPCGGQEAFFRERPLRGLSGGDGPLAFLHGICRAIPEL